MTRTQLKALENKRINYLEKNVGFDYILEVYNDREFTEVVSKMGGDVLTHRVYGDNPNNFRVYER